MQIKNQTHKRTLALTVTTALTAFALAAVAEDKARPKVDASKFPPAATKQGVSYAGDIKAIFDKSCIKCHGAEKAKAKLRLDSQAGALKGSENGKVIEAGSSTKSVLLINVARLGDEDDWMPPKDNKANIPALTSEQVGLIRAWIDQGAK